MRRRYAIALSLLAACAAPPPPPVAAPPPPLERICQEVLPLPERTVGALARMILSIAPNASIALHACDAETTWPISFTQSEREKPPVDVTLLHMEGDALLTFDRKNREAPTLKLCNTIDVALDDRHRVRAIGLWESSDDLAADSTRVAASRAELAWVELLSRTPSQCALGQREAPGQVGEAELAERLRCAMPNYVSPVPANCPSTTPAPSAPASAPEMVEAAVAKTHRFTYTGRQASSDPELTLLRPERCFYEPPPAKHDGCVAVYQRTGHPDERWYGRNDVTRTGENGEKNYVDSYLTFKALKRLEGERRKQGVVVPSEMK